MEDIEKEIQEKVIEKQPTPQPEVKPKKPRSEAQKAAFEKARLKRAENLKKKQEEEQSIAIDNINPETLEVKEELPPPKKKRGRPRGSTKAKKVEQPRYPEPVNHPVYQPVNHNIPFNQNTPQNFYQFDPRAFPPTPPAPAPVNNYYYYGAPPPQEPKELPRRAPTPPPQETSSEEEYEYGNPEYIQESYQRPEPKLQFRFA
jgi:hypothetical protein